VRAFLVLARRELAAYFLSPIAYATGTFFLVVMGASFWLLAHQLVQGAPGATAMSELFGSIFFWIAVLVTVPALTMRLFAEEKRAGTFETLMTAPVGEATVVLAKYAAALVFYASLWAPTLAYVAVLRACGEGAAPLDPGVLAACYLGALVLGACFLAAGVLVSTLTRSQVVAAIAGFAVLALVFLAGFAPYLARRSEWQEPMRYASVVAHMLDFSGGVVDTRPLVFCAVNTAWLLFAAVRVTESRRGR
jgi:ABC-2 type transport system permease protein